MDSTYCARNPYIFQRTGTGRRFQTDCCCRASRPTMRFVLNASTMDAATSSGFSCSQNLRTVQPSACRWSVVLLSRRALLRSFSLHQSVFFFGIEEWLGQECQKHPSIKIASRCRGKAMSIRHLDPAMRYSVRYRRPWRKRRLRMHNSAAVSFCRWRLILSATSALEADGFSPCAASEIVSLERIGTGERPNPRSACLPEARAPLRPSITPPCRPQGMPRSLPR